jgi:hypothetical protein
VSGIEKKLKPELPKTMSTLSGDHTRSEIADALARLRFDPRPDAVQAIIINKDVRDALVMALRR